MCDTARPCPHVGGDKKVASLFLLRTLNHHAPLVIWILTCSVRRQTLLHFLDSLNTFRMPPPPPPQVPRTQKLKAAAKTQSYRTFHLLKHAAGQLVAVRVSFDPGQQALLRAGTWGCGDQIVSENKIKWNDRDSGLGRPRYNRLQCVWGFRPRYMTQSNLVLPEREACRHAAFLV